MRCNKCGEDYRGLALDCRCTNYGYGSMKEYYDEMARRAAREMPAQNVIDSVPGGRIPRAPMLPKPPARAKRSFDEEV